ncbi:type III secretion system inner membrane ring subunit SctD [Achromobacter xylosoxidans]|uniref:type III secretion system inner membrane ring subunit SctD n=1 Tax=Alcaligenes xylosoxydans xylosoxydans TaxID=85698 RepID=UPI0006C109DA|nr:type III secretion system inner membrane ring subunit SctD [Achromobacter xylosoxidans]MBK1977929.1 type III secretion system inner membrane ring subunit SctD [Achromobacter xylosoxidans]MEC6408025.1 type III secretion system inner membrane ring subunit SctD [Achromobacter xylosoxidans]OFL39552.1 EscD/YscD/HrpQ family type III secretion system inner membrane ring protein [Achromobacter xylosoxidans]OMG90158.1 EscD/YscD/HrpQ family type III secretion system inner membrane ring protein [Achrom
MSEALELRVLSGLHRDARCLAADGAVLGADPACDIVLADDGMGPRAARLRIGETGWDLANDDGAPADPAGGQPRTPFNRPVPLGPVWITVARRGDPWANPPDAANDALGGGAAAAAAADDAAAPSVAPAAAAPNPDEERLLERRLPLPPIQGRRRKRDSWPVLLGLAAVVLTVVVAIFLAWMPQSTASRAPQVDPRLAAAEKSVGQISAVFERMGLASRLHVSMARDGVVTVSGWVRNAAEQDAVAAALSQIWPMPAMRISNEDAAVRTASTALRAFNVRYEPRYEGDGRLIVAGIASSARERASALDALRAQLPGMTVLGNDIALTQQVSDTLSSRLVDAGLSGVTLTWKPDHLEIAAGALDDDQQARLQETLDDFNKSHLGVARLAAASATAAADSVPFVIRSVVGGAQPFVVLEDGSKLLVGGVYRKYRLVAVENTRIIFEGPRTAIVTR